MTIEKLSDKWIGELFQFGDISKWIDELNYFYLIRAWGGHANDFDRFEAYIEFYDRDDLIHKLQLLGIQLSIIREDFPRPQKGVPYPADEYAKFKSEIKSFPDLEQPGHIKISGIPVFVWVGEFIQFSVSDHDGSNGYILGDQYFDRCKLIERTFDELEWSKFKSSKIESNVCCLTLNKYPEIKLHYSKKNTPEIVTKSSPKQKKQNSFWTRLFSKK